jgi:hypothetical protein
MVSVVSESGDFLPQVRAGNSQNDALCRVLYFHMAPRKSATVASHMQLLPAVSGTWSRIERGGVCVCVWIIWGGGGLAAPDALPQFGLICQDRPLRGKLQGYFKCIAWPWWSIPRKHGRQEGSAERGVFRTASVNSLLPCQKVIQSTWVLS